MSELKYPVGIQTFSKIIEEGYTYVDKTAYIKPLTSQTKIRPTAASSMRYRRCAKIRALALPSSLRKEFLEICGILSNFAV